MIDSLFFEHKKIKKKISLVFTNPKDRILDMGCGSNPWYHDSMKGNSINFDIKKTPVTDVVGDADTLTKYFAAASFDKIISINSLYYTKNPQRVIAHIHTILKAKGIFFCVVPFFYPLHDPPFDRYRFTCYGLQTIFEQKFYIRELIPVGSVFSIPALVTHVGLKASEWITGNKGLPAALVQFLFAPLSLGCAFLTIFDKFDKTERFPLYYIVIAQKK